VLQGPEQSFGVRIIVGDVRAAEGRHDPKPLQGRDHRASPHGFTGFGMQDEAARIDVALTVSRPWSAS
jgi:hypothetical protein